MEEYIKQRDKVLDYIDKNLNREMTLDELSSISCYSKYHFSRIFSNMMGETIFQYIHRLRLEKAAERVGMEEDISITSIAYELGFTNCASFSKSFKKYFGFSPSNWRKEKKNQKVVLRENSISGNNDRHLFLDNKELIWQYKVKNTVNVQVRILELREIPVVYIRHIGTSLGNNERFELSYETLLQWAAPRGLINKDEMDIYGIYHDNPLFTNNPHLRISAAIEANHDTLVSGDVGKMVLIGGKYAVAQFEFTSKEEYSAVFEFLYSNWLSQSNYKSDTSRYGYMCFLNSPSEQISQVKVNIPIKIT